MTAGADGLYGRWQTLQLLGPVFELTKRAAPRADFDHVRYDLAQLALHAVDHVVGRQASLEGSVSPERVIDHLRDLAERMAPDDAARPWLAVARTTFQTLLNEGRPHEANWVEPAGHGEDWSESRTYKFRLLRMVDTDEGAGVVATDEAIVLYLRALNTNLADQALALKLLVEIQMKAGEFDKALVSAREATRTARGLAASLRDKLSETRRDVRSVDWGGEMPAWLSDVAANVRAQLDRDRQLAELAEGAAADPEAAGACRQILEELRRSWEVWSRLERHLQQAVPVFLAAQEAQRFSTRSTTLTLDLTSQLLLPGLALPSDGLACLADRLAAGLFAPPTNPAWGVDELVKVLVKQSTVPERPDPEPEEHELGDADLDSIPDEVAAVAADIFAGALAWPVRLSDLLAQARGRAGEAGGGERLVDVIWGGCLWAYVTDAAETPDEAPTSPALAEALGPLAAIDDGTKLKDRRYRGPDLLVGTTAGFDALDTRPDSQPAATSAGEPEPTPSPMLEGVP
ncbi:MAG TPA: hypothetical protein VKI19_05110 [Acidimicrobiales bacterium]|nr:hypothetical protein [Acidimicrobiales bacterium]